MAPGNKVVGNVARSSSRPYLFLFVLALIAYLTYDYWSWTPQRAEQREVRSGVTTAANTAAKKSGELYNDMNAEFKKQGDTDTNVLRNTLMPRAEKANQIRQAYNEAIATTEGQTIGDARLFVDAKRRTWQGHVPFIGRFKFLECQVT